MFPFPSGYFQVQAVSFQGYSDVLLTLPFWDILAVFGQQNIAHIAITLVDWCLCFGI